MRSRALRAPPGVWRVRRRRSHWQTVLPLMVKVPLTLGVGDAITVTASAQFDSKLPPTYNLSAEIRRA